LSTAPDGRSLRFTVKNLGDFTSRVGEIRAETKLFAEGPYGVFTAAAARQPRSVALIAGGIGITPARSLLDAFDASDRDIVLVWRAARTEDFVLATEVASLAASPGLTVHEVVGAEIGDDTTDLLSTSRLRALVPDMATRAVFISGPPGFVRAVRRRVLELGVPSGQIHSEPFEL
jgi:ferredoxin-NADP reductase